MPAPTQEVRFFSSGRLRVGTAGATALDVSNLIGEVQDISIEDTLTRKELFDAAVNQTAASDSADHESKAKVKFEIADLQLKFKPFTTGGTFVGGVYTKTKTSVPPYCRIEIDLMDSQQNVHNFIATNAKFMPSSTKYGITDFGKITVEADIYPDPTTGGIYTLN
jgi:hypothetical protein